jgi:hypothetical protein
MMNPIGIRNEDRTRSRDPWFQDRTTVVAVPEHGGAGPSGTRVRRSAWPGRQSATGRSCGRPAPAGSGWTPPSGTTASARDATYAGPATTRAPSSVPPRGRASPRGRRTGQPRGSVCVASARSVGCGVDRGPELRWTSRASARACGGPGGPPASPRAPAWEPGGPPGPPWTSPGLRGLPRGLRGPNGTQAGPMWGAGRWRRGRACTSCRSRRGRVGCGRPSCRPGVGAGWRRRAPRPRSPPS